MGRKKSMHYREQANMFHEVPPNWMHLKGRIDIWWIVADGGILILLPFLLCKHRVWQHCKVRLFAVADAASGDNEEDIYKELKSYVNDFRLDVEVHVKKIDGGLDGVGGMTPEDDIAGDSFKKAEAWGPRRQPSDVS